MSVEFDEEPGQNFAIARNEGAPQAAAPGLTGLVMKTGLAKTETNAKVVMVVIAAIFFALSLILDMWYIYHTKSVKVDQALNLESKRIPSAQTIPPPPPENASIIK